MSCVATPPAPPDDARTGSLLILGDSRSIGFEVDCLVSSEVPATVVPGPGEWGVRLRRERRGGEEARPLHKFSKYLPSLDVLVVV